MVTADIDRSAGQSRPNLVRLDCDGPPSAHEGESEERTVNNQPIIVEHRSATVYG
jgi:hypothetical protein